MYNLNPRKMKKTLLLGMSFALGLSALAQQSNNTGATNVTTPLSKQNQPFVRLKTATGDETTSGVLKKGATVKKAVAKSPGLNPVLTSTTTTIGQTQYDLQTNSSVARRIRRHNDGTCSAIWTISPGGSPYTLRGTGYNYMDNTETWLYPDTTHIVLNRLESYRTGFPDLGLLRGTQDVIVCHETAGYTISQGTNSVKGAMPFSFVQTSAAVPSPTTGQGGIWPRLAIGGPGDSTMHVIGNYPDTNTVMAGVKQPMVYSRSQDGGVTWDIQAITLPGYDSTVLLYGGGEAYSIDAWGNTVAIVTAGLGDHVMLFKSTDNGTTFTRSFVDSFPYAPDYSVSAPVGYDSIPTNDGSVSVLVDAGGVVHVAYAYSEVGLDNTGASVFRPGSIGLVYWNDAAQTKVDIPIPLSSVDTDMDGLYYVGTLTTDANAARYRNASILTMPSVGRDAAGNTFITFSLPADNDVTGDDQSFRDIFAVSSSDGFNWSDAVNLTNTIGTEESFPSLAKNVDGFLHIVYQEDFEPGTALNNADADGTNNINYLKVDANLLLTDIKNNNGTSPSFAVGQNYPNPFNGTTNFAINLSKNANVSVTVTNIFGQNVLEANAGNKTPGVHTIGLDCTKLASGIYFYTVTAGTESITKKMIIE